MKLFEMDTGTYMLNELCARVPYAQRQRHDGCLFCCLFCYRIIIAIDFNSFFFFCFVAPFQLLIHFPVEFRAFMLFYRLISLLCLHQIKQNIYTHFISGQAAAAVMVAAGTQWRKKIPWLALLPVFVLLKSNSIESSECNSYGKSKAKKKKNKKNEK